MPASHCGRKGISSNTKYQLVSEFVESRLSGRSLPLMPAFNVLIDLGLPSATWSSEKRALFTKTS